MTDRIRFMAKAAASLAAFVLAVMASSAMGEQTSNSASAEFQIPAENLVDALNKFGKQTGMQVVYAPDLARGAKSRALSGKLTLDAALQRLLEGTGLTWDYVNSTTVILKKAPATSSVSLAGQMRVASLDDEGQLKSPESSEANSSSGVPEVLVKGMRSSNTDIRRT